MFVAILLFAFGGIAAAVGCFLVLAGLANVQLLICGLLTLLIGAVLISSSFIIGAIMDLEKAVKEKGNPPALPK
jgi:hypothetical protein